VLTIEHPLRPFFGGLLPVELLQVMWAYPARPHAELADGRIFTGRQAVASGLIDGLGGEAEARDWLAESHGILRTLPAREVEIDYDEEVWEEFFAGLVGKALFSERLRLDGLVSVWHPVLR